MVENKSNFPSIPLVIIKFNVYQEEENFHQTNNVALLH